MVAGFLARTMCARAGASGFLSTALRARFLIWSVSGIVAEPVNLEAAVAAW